MPTRYSQIWNQHEQEQARRALVQLVQPGEGTEDTRRIATHEELGDESWKLIQHLANKRLVVTGRDAQGRETAEVVHEALIQKVGALQGVDECRPGFPGLAGTLAEQPCASGRRAGRTKVPCWQAHPWR